MNKISKEIELEGTRQNMKGFDAVHDDSHSLDELVDHIIAYAQWAKQMCKMGSPEKFRRRIMQVATIAVKTCESFDRRLYMETHHD